MNELLSFSYQDRPVRTAGTTDAPLFVAADVCRVLELESVHKAVERLDEDERISIPVTDSSGRIQEMWAVTEAGLYALVLGSRKPEAKVFKRWINHEVLPAIRKTGRYDVRDIDLSDPLVVARQLQDATALFIESETARRELKHQLEIQAPAVAFARKVELSPVDINIGTFAKAIGWGPNKLHEELRRRGFMFRRDGHPVPKQRFVEAGLFTVKEVPVGERVFPVTAITGKGQLRLAKELGVVFQPALLQLAGRMDGSRSPE